MKKRVIAMLLVLSFLLSLLSGCGGGNNGGESSQNGAGTGNSAGSGNDGSGGDGGAPDAGPEPIAASPQYISRGQWIELLGQEMGMEEYLGESDYFTDVTGDSDIYPYVQSCYEWGVLALEEGTALRPDETATWEFVGTTAVLAIGELQVEAGTTKDEVLTSATAGGVVPQGAAWEDDVPFVDALSSLEVTKQLYLDRAEGEVVVSTPLEEVVDLTAQADQITVSGTEVTMPAEMAENLTTGSVFIAPGDAFNPYGLAMKVTSVAVDGEYAVVQTEEPDLGEVFDELNVYGTGVPDIDNIVVAEGVTMTSASNLANTGESQASFLGNLGGNQGLQAERINKGLSLNFNVNFTKGTVSLTPGLDDASVSVQRLIPDFLRAKGDIGLSPTDDLGKLFEKSSFSSKNIVIDPDENGNPKLNADGTEKVLGLDVEKKFSGGYEITGSLGIKNLYVDAGIEFKKVFGVPTGLKRVVVELNCDSSVQLSLKGELNGEISVATVPIPIGGGLSVDCAIVLYLDASGELSVKAEVSRNFKIEYAGGSIKRTQKGDQSISAELAIEIEAGVSPKITISALGIKVIDVKAKIGANATSSLKLAMGKNEETVAEEGKTVRKTTWYGKVVWETKISLPVITLEVGTAGTLANKLKITGKWSLISADKAPLKFQPDALNHEWPLWEYPEIEVLEEENEEGEDGQDGADNNNPYSTLVINQIMLTMDPGQQTQITMTSFPPNETVADVYFATGDPNVATVDRFGYVTAVGGGTTQIYVGTTSGGRQACVVTVSGTNNQFTEDDFL